VRAVLDANVLISALLSPDAAPSRILQRWLDGEFELIVSPHLLAEVERVLAYPKLRARVDGFEADEFVDLLRRTAMLVPDTAVTARSVDAADDYLISLAEASRAVLVSGDKHLLDLAESFPIETPADFLRRLEAAGKL
jgi:putative PIN family toxin of toxin-antitoxin system